MSDLSSNTTKLLPKTTLPQPKVTQKVTKSVAYPKYTMTARLTFTRVRGGPKYPSAGHLSIARRWKI